MAEDDLNLLTALDALLTEGSVVAAAARLHLSPSAMSRTLARLRAATGDQLLVRAGRGLVPTPHAEALRDRVRELTQDARAVLRPAEHGLDLANLERTFNLRTNEGFIEGTGVQLLARVSAEAPGVTLRFAPKPNKDVRPLREGLLDLDIGVLSETGPEVRIQTLYRDRYVGVAREGHPLLTEGPVTPERYVTFGHVIMSPRGQLGGPVDDALALLGLKRRVMAIVPSFPSAVAIAAGSDLLALVPKSYFDIGTEQRGHRFGAALRSFELPVLTPQITISQMWHPRFDADPAHRWLRRLVVACCTPKG